MGHPGDKLLLASLLICGWQEQFDCIAVRLTATHRYELVTQDGEGTRWGKSIAHLHVSWAAGRSEWPRIARMNPADVEKQDFCHLRQRACKCRSCGGPLCSTSLSGASLTRTESVGRPCLPSERSDVRSVRVHVQKQRLAPWIAHPSCVVESGSSGGRCRDAADVRRYVEHLEIWMP